MMSTDGICVDCIFTGDLTVSGEGGLCFGALGGELAILAPSDGAQKTSSNPWFRIYPQVLLLSEAE